jgi:uncharacterized cupin superfamily protein
MLRFVRSALFLLVAFCTCSVWAAPSGYVHELSGDVTLTDAGKPAVKAKTGDLFEQGAVFVTGADGKATIKFSDGQVVSLGPNAQFGVTTYNYNTANVADSNIVFNLVRGGMRFVTGLIGQTNNSRFAVRTPTLTAGVRGTDGQVVIAADGSTLVSVTSGVVTMTSPSGTVVVNAGNFTFYPPGATTPTASNVPVSSLPPAAAALANSLVALANAAVPAPNPVSVTQEAQKVIDAAATQSAPPAPPPPQAAPPASTPGGSGGGGGTPPSLGRRPTKKTRPVTPGVFISTWPPFMHVARSPRPASVILRDVGGLNGTGLKEFGGNGTGLQSPFGLGPS